MTGEPRRGAVDTKDGDGGALLGLDVAETAVFRAVFADLAAPLGLDGSGIVDRLSAGATLGEALDLPAGLGEVLYGRAHHLFTAGRLDRAEPLFRTLCIIDGRTADHWVGYALCLRRRGEEGEAALSLATAAALRPDWAVPQFHAAQSALAQDRWTAAGAHLDAFQSKIDASVPVGMRREAARQRQALELRSAGAAAP